MELRAGNGMCDIPFQVDTVWHGLRCWVGSEFENERIRVKGSPALSLLVDML